MFRQFIDDVKTRVNETWSLKDAPKYITKHTYILDAKYSFKDHEFQETILADDAQIVNTQKCSQIGMSEAMARWSVAAVNMIPNFKVITTFPFSGDASDFAKTRIDPFIASSPKLRDNVNSKLNNSEIKQFGTSFLYFRGTNGKTQAISIPADCIVSDEIDRSDPDTLKQYMSRLTHSKWKMRRNFSTPTIAGYGIALEMETSKRFRNICKCSHCNHFFIPDYFEHVKIPGYDGLLKALTKASMPKTRYLEAKLLCPKCGVEPDLGPAYREYVIENTLDNYEAHGYYVSPFDAPKIITVVDLLKASTMYARYSEFENQNLGITSEDSSESITLADLNKAFMAKGTDLRSSQIHCMGIDVGNICHIAVGRMTVEGQLLVVHRERCPISTLEERKRKLQIEWRVLITVMDSQPFIDTVQRFQKVDKNLYGAVYSNSKNLESFKIKMFEGDEGDGKLPIHTVQVNRDKSLDMLMGVIKAGEMVVAPMSEDEDETFQKQLLDMKRIQVFDEHQELTWQWVKSVAGNDHYHHTTHYLWLACQLRGTASRNVPLTGIPIMKKFKVKHPKMVGYTG
jgi:hypothetical protein